MDAVEAHEAPMSAARAIVVGGGVSGLATAALFAADGFRVTLLESRRELGGRAGVVHEAGFQFDTGPSWYMMPEVYDHFFRLLGETRTEQFGLTRLDPAYRVFFEDGSPPIDVTADAEANVRLFERIEPGAGRALRRYLDSADEAYKLAWQYFLYSTFSSFHPFMTGELVGRAGRLLRLLAEPLDQFIRDHVHDRRLRQILGYPSVFLGSAPQSTPSLYHLMSRFDLADGVYYPDGGFARFIDSLAELVRSSGVDVKLGNRVSAITTEQRRSLPAVTGVTARRPDGSAAHYRADVVVSTADLHYTEHELLPSKYRSFSERWWRRRNPGPSAVLVMLGVRGKLPQLTHHNLVFTTDWAANFRSIFKSPTAIPRPASMYVSNTTSTDRTMAPPDHENLFLLVPVPADTGIGRSGDTSVEEIADAAIAQLAAWSGVPDLATRIVTRRTRGPGDFDADFHAWHGGALGPAHTLRQSAFLRGSNVSRRVRGLVYAGASTIPGIGVPMCLISAELALKRVHGDTSTSPLPEPGG